MKLGKRLQQLESIVNTGYDHIWDCCCDHGLLGAALLSRQAAPHIHFVDIVPELMDQVEHKLARFYPLNKTSTTSAQWQVHCMDVSALPVQKFTGKHLVIIAGIGGELMSNIMNKLHSSNLTADIDFLLSPANDPYILRQLLIQLEFNLYTETLITENKRFYEALLVSAKNHSLNNLNKNAHRTQLPVSAVGNLLWQTNTVAQFNHATDYLQKTRAHYKRMQLSANAHAQQIIDAYNTVTIECFHMAP